jgi:hypothetical protein
MKEYHKIQTVFNRDPETNFKTLIEGDYALPEFEYLKDNEWIFTEKVDGTNTRVMFDGEKITFGGKTDRAQIPATLVEVLQHLFLTQLDRFKDIFDCPVCLYGEGYGAKVQKGGCYRQDQSFILFDVRIGDWWLKRKDVLDIANKLSLEIIIPVVGSGTLTRMVEMARDGFRSSWGDFFAEGIVARPAIELKARDGSRIITKIKHKDFIHKA